MKYLLSILSILMGLSLSAQNRIYQDVPLFKSGIVNDIATNTLKINNTTNIHVDIPGKGFGLNLHKVNILSEDFFVETSSGEIISNVEGTFYQGNIDNLPNSVATVSMYKGDVICSFSDQTGNYEISGQKSKPYTLRLIPSERAVPFECYTQDAPSPVSVSESPTVACKAIQIYFEADYKLYQDKGSSVTNTVNYITALFNQISMLYTNEQITVQISQIKVWNTPDPYIPYTNTSSVLNAFRNTLGSNFNGNLAHFLSTRNLGGGIAYVDVLCIKQYAFGVSAITTTFQNVPTYSWSVEVVTHELGHNIGSWHTQSCNWPNGALDNCVPTEGGCPPGPTPVNGGTIMSYCHLTQYGINFANGFGPVPGNLIRNKFNNAPCLTGTSAAPTNLQTTGITNTTATIQWSVVSGSQSYTIQYKPVVGTMWTTLSVGLNTSYTITGLVTNTQYHWQVKTDCSNYTVPVVFTTTGSGGGNGCNTLILPSTSNITQTSAMVFWTPLNGVTTYNLQYKASSATNWIEFGLIPSTSLTLTNLTSNTNYMVRVRPDCNPNYGPIVQFVTLSGGTGCPAPINLQVTNLTSTSAIFSWQAGNSPYQIQLKFPGSPNFSTIGSSFVNPTVHFYGFTPASTYEWRVKNSCSTWSNTFIFTTPANLVDQPDVVTPNPTSGIFRFGNTFGRALLYDIRGKKAAEFEMDGNCVDITNLPSGVYFLRVNGKVYKIVKI